MKSKREKLAQVLKACYNGDNEAQTKLVNLLLELEVRVESLEFRSARRYN